MRAFVGIAAALLLGAKSMPHEAPHNYQSEADWSQVDTVLQNAVQNGVFPGCSAAVIDNTGTVVYLKSFGHQTYGLPTPGILRCLARILPVFDIPMTIRNCSWREQSPCNGFYAV